MKKIMFNDRYGLTKAVLDGRKTMTRRIVTASIIRIAQMEVATLGGEIADRIFDHAFYYCPEKVAVAQSYKSIEKEMLEQGLPLELKDEVKRHKGYNNKMFVKAEDMPHCIRITDIKVERLQDISDEDCLKEGIYASNAFEIGYGAEEAYVFSGTKEAFSTPREAFAALIDKVSGKGTWERNPWVFAYSFELIN